MHDAGDVVVLGKPEKLRKLARFEFATGYSVRRASIITGDYQVQVAARFITVAQMKKVLERYED